MFTTFAALLLAPAQPPKKEPPKPVVSAEEAKKLAGTWVAEAVRVDGKPWDGTDWKGGEITFTEKGFTADRKLQFFFFAKGEFMNLDATGKGPARMALRVTQTLEGGKQVQSEEWYLWIYELKGDVLVLGEGYTRYIDYAKDFDKGSFTLVTLKRKPAKK